LPEKKARQLAGRPEEQFKNSLSQFLQRRGFPYDIIRATTDELWTTIGAPVATRTVTSEH
jgi:SOS response regulatory protein OraA/RecX